MLNDRLKEIIKAEAEKEPEKECCGLIIYVKGELVVKSCVNRSRNPLNHFVIHHEDISAAKTEGSLVGFFHSHTEDLGGLTQEDIAMAERRNLTCILYHLKTKTFEEYEPRGYELPYEGRPFVLNLLDCYALVQDYYKRELNIDLKHFYHDLRSTGEWERYECVLNNPDLLNHYKSMGFQEVDTLKEYDILLLKTLKIRFPVHSMLYLGSDIVLHHPGYRNSVKEHYSNVYKLHTVHVLRHPTNL